jgi:hypothetical protein
MYCRNCGIQLPDDSAFCNRCGVPQLVGTQSLQPEPQWEICEVHIRTTRQAAAFRNGRLAVEAVVMGPKGRYTVEALIDLPEKATILASAVDELTDKLLRDGWQPLGTRPHHIRPLPRFRRKIMLDQNRPTWETCEIGCGAVKRRNLFGKELCFVARRGDQGDSGPVMSSPPFYYYDAERTGADPYPEQDQHSVHALETLVRNLSADGWEEVEPGDVWFSRRFRRRL